MAQESLLKKEFKSADVNRARNLVNKDFSAKTIDGIGYSKAYKAYVEGDTWEESGRTWTIKDGIRQNVTKLDAAKKILQIPLVCPKCAKSLKHHISQKMYKIHKMCFDCVIDYEAELRKAGLYDSYEKAMMQGSIKAFAKDIEDWMLDNITATDTFVTEQGDVEDWGDISNKHKQEQTDRLMEFLLHVKSHIEQYYIIEVYLLRKLVIMAKVKAASSTVKLDKPKVSRPGVHSKCKSSSLKQSKNYKKLYKGQGQVV